MRTHKKRPAEITRLIIEASLITCLKNKRAAFLAQAKTRLEGFQLFKGVRADVGPPEGRHRLEISAPVKACNAITRQSCVKIHCEHTGIYMARNWPGFGALVVPQLLPEAILRTAFVVSPHPSAYVPERFGVQLCRPAGLVMMVMVLFPASNTSRAAVFHIAVTAFHMNPYIP
jgi:hypothetical protein